MATGQVSDISSLVIYSFYEEVYFHDNLCDFPSDSTERKGNWVGISEHVGDALTYKVLSQDTCKILHTSRLRSALTPGEKNL